ncbi:MAG: TadE family protein [bacterium]
MKKNSFFNRSESGQAMVELIICLIVLPLFVTGIVRFGQTLIIQQRLLMAAKHGAILRSTDLVADTYVKSEIRKFLGDGKPKMESSQITVKLSKITYFGNPISEVEVGYKIKVPKFSNNFFQPFRTEQITLRESAFCANFRRLTGTPYTPDF